MRQKTSKNKKHKFFFLKKPHTHTRKITFLRAPACIEHDKCPLLVYTEYTSVQYNYH